MDYHRIYREFIADRKRREAGLTGYVERHHILPRCMGGGDEVENLVRLIPEDHFFAHLLLAKAHGGKCWTALAAMANLTNKHGDLHRGEVKRRARFGHIRRALAEYYRQVLSGPDSKIADQTVYELRHSDGRTAKGRRLELIEMTGVRRQEVARLVTGTRMMAKGWYNPAFNPEGRGRGFFVSQNRRSKEAFKLYHFDGSAWSGTRWDFNAEFGSQLTFQSPDGHCLGWYRSAEYAARHDERKSDMARTAAAARGCISGASNPRADPTIYEFWNFISGQRTQSTRFDLCAGEGILYGELGMVIARKRLSAKGWTLWERRNEKFRRPMVSRKDRPALNAT